MSCTYTTIIYHYFCTSGQSMFTYRMTQKLIFFLAGFSKYQKSLVMMIMGRFLMGTNNGFCSGAVVIYLAEISPTKIRGTVRLFHLFSSLLWFTITSLKICLLTRCARFTNYSLPYRLWYRNSWALMSVSELRRRGHCYFFFPPWLLSFSSCFFHSVWTHRFTCTRVGEHWKRKEVN